MSFIKYVLFGFNVIFAVRAHQLFDSFIVLYRLENIIYLIAFMYISRYLA